MDNIQMRSVSLENSMVEMMKKLQERAGKSEILAKEMEIKEGDQVTMSIKDIKAQEAYELKKPALLGLMKKPIGLTEAADRLSKGKTVIVDETLKISGNVNGTEKVISKERAPTYVNSFEEMESFTRIEAQEHPKTPVEEVAQKLENIEFKKASDRPSYFEIHSGVRYGYGGQIVAGKEISSLNAANSLLNGKPVVLVENVIKPIIVGYSGYARRKDIGAVPDSAKVISSVEELEKFLKEI